MAALAVHVAAEDWGDGGIINWIREGMNFHPEFLPSFLELLRVLPEVHPVHSCLENLFAALSISLTHTHTQSIYLHTRILLGGDFQV